VGKKGERQLAVAFYLLFPVHDTVLGAHVAPELVGGALMRLYELTVGLVMA
jgi:hypothetical protein